MQMSALDIFPTSAVEMFATLCSNRCLAAIADGLEGAKNSWGDEHYALHMRKKIEECTSYAGGSVTTVSQLWAVIAGANLDKATRMSVLASIEAGLDEQERDALREFANKLCWFLMNHTSAVASVATSYLGEVGMEALRLCDAACGGDWWQWLQGVMTGSIDWEERCHSLEWSNDDINDAGVQLLDLVSAMPEYAAYKSGYW